MQDRLREIEGTLARTKERKNTILYKLSKRRNEEERLARLGVRKIPGNPQDVDSVPVIKYALFSLKREIGDKIARMRDPLLTSIEKDGEAVVRAKNDEINKLLARQGQWNKRLAALSGDATEFPPRKKAFFGCAKELPEATLAEKRKRVTSSDSEGDDDDERPSVSPRVEESNETSDSSAIPTALYGNGVLHFCSSDADSLLLKEERAAEKRLREAAAEANSESSLGGNEVSSDKSGLVLSYYSNGVISVPDEKHFELLLVEKRKKALQQRLQTLKKKSAQ